LLAGLEACVAKSLQKKGGPATPLTRAEIETSLEKARVFVSNGHLDSAMRLTYSLRQELAQSPEDPLFMQISLQEAEIMRMLHRYREGISIILAAVAHSTHKQDLARAYNRMASQYYELGFIDSAQYFTELSENSRLPKQTNLEYRNIWMQGVLDIAQGKFKAGATGLEKALAIMPDSDLDNQSMILSHLGGAYNQLGQPEKALAILASALDMAKQYGNIAQKAHVSRMYFSQLMGLKNRPVENTVFDQMLGYQDSLLINQQASNVALYEAREELSKQRENITALIIQAQAEKERRRLMVLTSLGLLVVVVLILLFYGTARRQRRFILEQNKVLSGQQQELESRQRELELLNNSKDALLSVVSHDVRGPLLTLGTTLQLLAQGHLSEQETKTIVQGLAERVHDTETLLNDVLLWTKGNMQGLHTQEENLEPASLLAQVLVQVRPLLQTNRVTVRQEGVATPFVGDEGLAKVVVRNLLTNAIRHGAKHGTVTVRFVQAGHEAGIEIEDQGKGMPTELVRRLEAQEAEAPLPTRAMLSLGGLGLVLVKDFVSRQHGRISVVASPAGTKVAVWFKAVSV